MASEAAPGSQSHRMVEVEGPREATWSPFPAQAGPPRAPAACPVFAGRDEAWHWGGSPTPREGCTPVPQILLPRCSSPGGCPRRAWGFLPAHVSERMWRAPCWGPSCHMALYLCEMGSSCLADTKC